MNSSFVTAGEYVLRLAQFINFISWYVYIIAAVIVGGLLLLRFLNDAFRVSPFGHWYRYTSDIANSMLRNMRNSRFYYSLKRAFNFDPAVPMLLVGTAIVCYAVAMVVNYLIVILTGLGNSLLAFGGGSSLTGVRFLVGTVLLGAIFFLLALMLIIFVYWIFGLFSRIAYRALERMAPLLRVFEFGGATAGWSFLILGIALSFAATAVQAIFLS